MVKMASWLKASRNSHRCMSKQNMPWMDTITILMMANRTLSWVACTLTKPHTVMIQVRITSLASGIPDRLDGDLSRSMATPVLILPLLQCINFCPSP